MPFLPTLIVVAVLGAASLYCPSSDPARPASRADLARSDPLTTASLAPVASAPSPTAFAPIPAIPAGPGRLPAALIFAEAFPLDAAAPPATASALHAGVPTRPAPRLAAATRRPCPGRRCPEAVPRGPDPFAAAHAEAAEPVGSDATPHPALPFADTVAETLAPAAAVLGDAAALMRSGAAAVQGSVSLAVADCLR